MQTRVSGWRIHERFLDSGLVGQYSQNPRLLQSESFIKPANFNNFASTGRSAGKTVPSIHRRHSSLSRPFLALVRSQTAMSHWSQKVVAVTGGSAGLGLVIARRFAAKGARVALIARSGERLAAAVSHFASGHVLPVSADVTDRQQTDTAIETVIRHYGGVDVLVNNVGVSCRTELFATRNDDYRSLMEINLLAAVNCTSSAIHALQQSSGHVVNIGSLSSKTAWPFMAPYTTSKFALAAFNHHLRLEGPPNVHYMLVCSGPIKRDDAGIRYDEQAAGLPDKARQPGAGARIRGISPERLADQIIRGCEKRKLELMPLPARLIYVALAISPRWGDWLLRRKMRK
jgi:NAD(P)-dependent dehydrogenase (short-subunit alcohol dehydrogenase family)